ncbi:M23/M56 family metallopeptidase [Sediminitomix flava]|uniref:BlaR1 peptidase M56 n=1 Tax=Sediminitomix flava TaxID=379075 RepID=A0A315Z7A3_SEDFL|nr:M23/M56 family metallopeptidase [Sediminitomix flava]PWJ40112.1 BlaR1 peptidase M56 [Sediminitomix flava]
MIEFLHFLWKSSVLMTIPYLFFRVLFQKATFHQLNRGILYLILISSILGPLVSFDIPIEDNLKKYTLWIEDFEKIENSQNIDVLEVSQAMSFEWSTLLFVIYIFGVILFLIRFIIQFRQLISIRSSALKTEIKGNTFYLTNHPSAPFSFFHWIFLPSNYKSIDGIKSIITHEQAHVRQLHSFDSILLECYTILFWCNPFAFVLKNSFNILHEYLADQKVLSRNESEVNYLKLMLSQVENKHLLLSKNFGSKLKKRVQMIQNNKSSRLKQFSYLLFIPLLGILIQAISIENSSFDNEPSIVPLKMEKVEVSSHFGMRFHPISKKKLMHKGIDFRAKIGTPVVATANGRVILKEFKGKGIGHGRQIIIGHDQTYKTSYSQLSGFNVEVGDYVSKGDVIGFVGSSGNSTGPHLHYEVIKAGEQVDPVDYFVLNNESKEK